MATLIRLTLIGGNSAPHVTAPPNSSNPPAAGSFPANGISESFLLAVANIQQARVYSNAAYPMVNSRVSVKVLRNNHFENQDYFVNETITTILSNS